MSCMTYSCRVCDTIFFESGPCPNCKSVDVHGMFDELHDVERDSDDDESD